MQMTFDDWIREMTAERFELPGGAGAGATENLWSLSFSADKLPSAADLTRFIEAAVDVRRAQAESIGMKPATFYLWNDEQAGQLRFSVARCLPDSLPFRCAVAPADAASEIIGGYLASSRVDGLIPWSELDPIGVDEPETNRDQPYRLRVWALRLA
jgi:hypothetical protein